MFIKYSDKTPKVDVQETRCACMECGSVIIIANGKAKCGCDAEDETNGVKSIIKIVTQKKEKTNKEK